MNWLKRNKEESHPMATIDTRMQDFFNNFWKEFETWPFSTTRSLTKSENFIPQIEVKESENSISVRAELPGLSEKDIDVSLENDVLTIKGEKNEEQEDKRDGYFYSECRYGSFYRRIQLPAGVHGDKITATFKDGVLDISIPRDSRQTKKITVSVK